MPEPMPRSAALVAALARFADLQTRCIDPDTFDQIDFELWYALDEHAQGERTWLDLSAHAQALQRAPAELMEGFFDVCRQMDPPLQAIILPAGDLTSHTWLEACPAWLIRWRESEAAC